MPKQNTWAALYCRDLIYFISLYSATAKLSAKLCETADVTSNLGSDLIGAFRVHRMRIANF